MAGHGAQLQAYFVHSHWLCAGPAQIWQTWSTESDDSFKEVTSTAYLSCLRIHPQSTAEYVSTGQLSNYLNIVISGFFSTTGHIQESRYHDGWSLLLRPGTEHTAGSNQTVNSTENSYLCYKGFPWHSAATTRLWANQHSLDIITFIMSYHLVGSPWIQTGKRKLLTGMCVPFHGDVEVIRRSTIFAGVTNKTHTQSWEVTQ